MADVSEDGDIAPRTWISDFTQKSSRAGLWLGLPATGHFCTAAVWACQQPAGEGRSRTSCSRAPKLSHLALQPVSQGRALGVEPVLLTLQTLGKNQWGPNDCLL